MRPALPIGYRARCPTCSCTGREWKSLGPAEESAREHTRKLRHVTHVIDQYGIRIVGSTVHLEEEM